MAAPTLTIDGAVARPTAFRYDDLAALAAHSQVPDVSAWDPQRAGAAVLLDALLELAAPDTDAAYLTLHATHDDFHASIPLAPVRGRACVIYQLEGAPLPGDRGGPFRFFIRDHAACQTHEIDDCANVKHVDRIELSATPGHDNRPRDEAEHRQLHDRQHGGA